MRAAEEGQNQTKQILLFTTTEKQCSTFLPRCLKTNAEKKMGSQMKKYNNFKANISTDLPADLKGNLVIVKNI